MIHGYGDYIGRYAVVARHFASHGYDVVGIDQRGCGFSEGSRGVLCSQEQMRDDVLAYTELVNGAFGGVGVPHFSFGNSMGGAIQIMISNVAPDLFNGMTLTVPYIALHPKSE